MVLNGPLTTEDVDKALALRSFSGGGSGPTGPTGPGVGAQGPTGPAGPAGPTGPTGGSGLAATQRASGTGVALTALGASLIGGAVSITVPAGGGKIVLTGSVGIANSAATANANIQLLIDGVVQTQVPGTVPGNGNLGFALTWESASLTAGAHTIDLQGATSGTMTSSNASLVGLAVTV